MTESRIRTPHVVHIIQHLIPGGLENGLVNLINNMEVESFDHTIICLSHYSEFRDRIESQDVHVISLNKKPGHDPRTYFALWKILRELRPDIVHTRNFGTLDCAIVAQLAGIRQCIHGQHGFALEDVGGIALKRRLLRRICHPFVKRHVVLSHESKNWLRRSFGVSESKICQIYNGVDVNRFSPNPSEPVRNPILEVGSPDEFVIGTVERLDPVKDPMNLARAFAKLVNDPSGIGENLRLLIVGDGPLHQDLVEFLGAAGCAGKYTITGTVDNVDSYLRCMDVFVMPSRIEGISNAILEAMASGLPVIATSVGGNSELVVDSCCGFLVPAESPDHIADRVLEYHKDPELRQRHALKSRERAKTVFSLRSMVEGYTNLYKSLLVS